MRMNKSIGFKAPAKDFTFGDQMGKLLESILPADSARTAAITCRITVNGPNSVGQSGKNWGEWIRTNLFTGGDQPQIAHEWQVRRDGYIGGNSHEAANVILECFDLSLDDVFNWKGRPDEGEKYTVSLREIVEACNPDILTSGQSLGATA